MTEKPPVLSERQFEEWCKAHQKQVWDRFEAQRDADVEWYETHSTGIRVSDAITALLEGAAVLEARQDTAREIHDFLQMHLYARPDKPTATMKFTDWVKLRELFAKYGVK